MMMVPSLFTARQVNVYLYELPLLAIFMYVYTVVGIL